MSEAPQLALAHGGSWLGLNGSTAVPVCSPMESLGRNAWKLVDQPRWLRENCKNYCRLMITATVAKSTYTVGHFEHVKLAKELS